MITVIVPVLNAQPYLGEALASIAAQGDLPMQWLVVDGGSTDGSVEVVRSFSEIELIRQQGRGLAAARNEGLAHAQGEMVAFLDADDRWAAGKLTAQLAYLAEHRDCPAATGHFVRFAEPGEQPSRYTGDWLGRPEPGYTPGALLARRTLFDQVGLFDPALQVGCDSDWFVRARDAGIDIVVLPAVVLHKRIHAGNLSQQVTRYRRELLTVTRRSLARRGVIAGPPTTPESDE